jgi:hypothetical protein
VRQFTERKGPVVAGLARQTEYPIGDRIELHFYGATADAAAVQLAMRVRRRICRWPRNPAGPGNLLSDFAEPNGVQRGAWQVNLLNCKLYRRRPRAVKTAVARMCWARSAEGPQYLRAAEQDARKVHRRPG